jgi:multicomponent Na+:H+ antiporter subunit D
MAMPEHAAVLLVFVPLLAACAAIVLPARWRAVPVVAALAALPLLLLPLSAEVQRQGLVEISMAGHAPPLGIRLRVDALSLLMLWLVALVGGASGMHALALHRPSAPEGASMWPLWLLMTAGMNALFLAADLFNVYVTIELMTLAAIALVVAQPPGGAHGKAQRAGALRAAMRYLLLAMLGSLAYLLGVALLYGALGTLDLYDAAARMGARQSRHADRAGVDERGPAAQGRDLSAARVAARRARAGARAGERGAVGAGGEDQRLSAVPPVVLERRRRRPRGGLVLLGLLGAGAILYGSAAALVQDQLKRVVAYSTVAQLGYLLLVFPLMGHASAWSAAGLQLVSHGLAKAGMFLAAANIVHALGSGRLDRLAGADKVLPASLFAFGLAGVSLMGLPPSGGFLAKWLLLEAAWATGGWGWIAVVLAGSLLAAGYVFRVLAAVFGERCSRPAAVDGGHVAGHRAGHPADRRSAPAPAHRHQPGWRRAEAGADRGDAGGGARRRVVRGALCAAARAGPRAEGRRADPAVRDAVGGAVAADHDLRDRLPRAQPDRARFFGFFSLSVAATMGIATAGNLFTFFIFYELLTLATWPLVVHRGTRRRYAGGRTYLAYTLAAARCSWRDWWAARAAPGPRTSSSAARWRPGPTATSDRAARGHLRAAGRRPGREGGAGAAARLAAAGDGGAGAGERAAARGGGGEGRRLRPGAPGRGRLRRRAGGAPGLGRGWRCGAGVHDRLRLAARAGRRPTSRSAWPGRP